VDANNKMLQNYLYFICGNRTIFRTMYFFVGIELCIFLYGFAKKQNGYKRSSKLQHCLSELFSAPDNLN